MHGTSPASPALATVPPAVPRPFLIQMPTAPRRPLVVASPHSGDHYPSEFLAASRLDPVTLRKSEDCFVDEICGLAPELGAPLLCALYPRAFVDCNREPWELDPMMFEDALPDFVNHSSPRVAVGLGTIARLVADGQPIYRGKLRFAEAESRIEQLYRPYHAALGDLVDETVAGLAPASCSTPIPCRRLDPALDRRGRGKGSISCWATGWAVPATRW